MMRSKSIEFPRDIVRAFQELLHNLGSLEKNSIESVSLIGDDASVKLVEFKKHLVELVGIFVKSVSAALPSYQKGVDEKLEFIALSFLDERFIRMEWSLSEPWSENPLEKDAFGTRNAGSEVFDRIDALSDDRLNDKYLALLYFLILSCGFAGKYDPKEDETKLEEYKNNLFSMIAKAFEISDFDAEAYLQESFLVSSNAARSYLPTQRKFNVFAVGFVFLTIILVQLFWFLKSSDLVEIASQIVQMGSLY